jgi:hypothetical protein
VINFHRFKERARRGAPKVQRHQEKNTVPTKTYNHATAAKVARDLHAVTRAEFVQASEAYEQAVSHLAELTEAMGSGAVSPTALRTANDVLTIAEAVLATKKQALAASERRLLNEDTELAQAFAPILAAALPKGIEPQVLPHAPTSTPDVALVPQAFLVQQSRTLLDPYEERHGKLASGDTRADGRLGGSVEVLYYHSDFHRALESDALELAAERERASVKVTDRGITERDGAQVQRLEILVPRVYAPLPKISEPGPLTALEGMITYALKNRLEPAINPNLVYVAPPQQALSTWTKAKLVNTSTKSGVRHLSVSTETYASTSLFDLVALRDYLTSILNAQTGKAVNGLGRIKSASAGGAELMNAVQGSGAPGVKVRCNFVLVSSVPE